MKKCNKCQEFKELELFHIKVTGEQGRNNTCKICRKIYYLENLARELLRSKINKEKNKEINKEVRKIYLKNNKDKNNKKSKEWRDKNKDHLVEYRSSRKDKTKKYREKNKEKLSQKAKESYLKNKDKIRKEAKEKRYKNIELYRKKSLECYYKNKENIITKKKEAHRKDPEKRNRYFREYNKERTAKDSSYKLSKNLRTRLGNAIRCEAKSGSAVRDLGCSIPELKNYLESKFQPDMSWENWNKYGWHIDHILPLSKFDLTDREQLLKATHYTNLQPLWAKDNLSKNNKMPKDL